MTGEKFSQGLGAFGYLACPQQDGTEGSLVVCLRFELDWRGAETAFLVLVDEIEFDGCSDSRLGTFEVNILEKQTTSLGRQGFTVVGIHFDDGIILLEGFGMVPERFVGMGRYIAYLPSPGADCE